MIIAAVFIPFEDFQLGYLILSFSEYAIQNINKLLYIFQYSERTYMGYFDENNDWKEPLFHPKIWNDYNNSINNRQGQIIKLKGGTADFLKL